MFNDDDYNDDDDAATAADDDDDNNNELFQSTLINHKADSISTILPGSSNKLTKSRLHKQ